MNNIVKIALVIASTTLVIACVQPRSTTIVCPSSDKSCGTKSLVIRESFYKKLVEVQSLSDMKKYAIAEQKLQLLLADQDINAYERVVAMQYYGGIYDAQGEHENAIGIYLAALEVDNIPKNAASHIYAFLARKYREELRYDLALEYLDSHDQNLGFDQLTNIDLRAQIHYLQKEYPKTAKLLEKGIADEQERKRKYPETANPSLLRILFMRSCYEQMGNKHGLQKTDKLLTRYYPDEENVKAWVVPSEDISIVSIGPINPEDVRFSEYGYVGRFPQNIGEKSIDGYVKVGMDIDEEGKVVNLKVIESEPAGIFDKVVLDAFRTAKARRTLVDGRFVAITGVEKTIHFKMSKDEQ